MRRLLVPLIMTLVMVVTLAGLGVWQLQRKGEKEALIAALDARLVGAPAPLPPERAWSSITQANDEFRRVRFSATFKPGQALVFSGGGSALRADVSGPGYWVFNAAQLPSGGVVVVDRGFAADGEQGRIAPAAGEADFVGVIRFPETAGTFTPQPDRSKGLWFARTHRDIAQASGWGEVAPFYIDLEQPMPAGGVPKPGPVRVQLRNEHLQYAITWFGLALAVLASFVFWLIQNWRVRPRP